MSKKKIWKPPEQLHEAVAYCDGGCDNHKHSQAYGSWAVYLNGILVDHQYQEFPELRTNNEAEYRALQLVLDYIAENIPSKTIVRVYSDSQLMVEQANGYWKIRADNLASIGNWTRNFLLDHKNVRLSWTSRECIVEVLGH